MSQADVSNPTYTEFTYQVVGTGSDTLELEGYEDSGYNHVDDIVVAPTGTFATPEPGTLGLFLGGLAPLAVIIRRRGKLSLNP